MTLKLGLQLGYWGAGPRPDFLETAVEAEALGYDCVFTAEAWGSDVFTPLAWIGAHTSKIRLGTGIAQISARTPAATAMHAMTLDHLSGGPRHPRPRRVRPPGRRGLVRTTLRQAAVPHPGLRRDHPEDPCPGGAGDAAQRALPAALHRRGFLGPGQAAPLDRPPAPLRPADLPRRRRAQERRPGRRTLQRLAAAVLLALPPRGLRRLPRRPRQRLRSRLRRPPARRRRRRRGPPADQAVPGALRRRQWAPRSATSTAN